MLMKSSRPKLHRDGILTRSNLNKSNKVELDGNFINRAQVVVVVEGQQEIAAHTLVWDHRS